MINEEIINYAKSLENLHIARWEDLPDFDLYATQVVDFIKKELFFLEIFGEDFVTKSMLNNYVKNKMVPKPFNKKYKKDSLAMFITITLLKQIFELADIQKGMDMQIKNLGSIDFAYNTFIQEFEGGINKIFNEIINNELSEVTLMKNIQKPIMITHLATEALVAKLLVKKVIDTDGFLLNGENYE